MRRILSYLCAAAAVAVLGLPPARAADAPVETATAQAVTPPAPDPRIWQTAPVPQDLSSQAQRVAGAARNLSGQLIRNAGTVHPGEDQLGTGTSITH